MTVYNGFSGDASKQVLKAEYEAWKGEKYTKEKEISQGGVRQGPRQVRPDGPYQKSRRTRRSRRSTSPADAQANLGKYKSPDGHNGIKLTSVEVTKSVYNAAPGGYNNNAKHQDLRTRPRSRSARKSTRLSRLPRPTASSWAR